MSIRKKIEKFVEFIFVYILLLFCKILPFYFREKFTILIASVLASTLKKKKELIRKNIASAFPEKDVNWVEKIARLNIRNLGKFVAEFIEISSFIKRDIDKLINFSQTREEIERMTRDGGIVILGHLGNWEWTGWAISRWMPGHIYAMVKRQSNPWTDRLFANIRTKGGIQGLYTDKGIYQFKRVLRDKKILCILADQDAGRHGHFFPFLNRQASTFMGPAMLARISGCRVFFGASWHEEGKFRFHFEEIPLPAFEPRKNPKEWDSELTKSWIRLLESFIKQHPDDYFWVHNRWKTQPSMLFK